MGRKNRAGDGSDDLTPLCGKQGKEHPQVRAPVFGNTQASYMDKLTSQGFIFLKIFKTKTFVVPVKKKAF